MQDLLVICPSLSVCEALEALFPKIATRPSPPRVLRRLVFALVDPSEGQVFTPTRVHHWEICSLDVSIPRREMGYQLVSNLCLKAHLQFNNYWRARAVRAKWRRRNALVGNLLCKADLQFNTTTEGASSLADG